MRICRPERPVKKKSATMPADLRPGFRRAQGFSLVELLIVVTLIPIVAITLYSTFRSSTILWKNLNREIPLEDVEIFFLKSDRDFNQMFRYSALPFSGNQTEIGFAAFIDTVPELGGSRGIGFVRYYYDDVHGRLMREQSNLSQVLRDRGGDTRAALPGVTDFQVSYFFRKPTEKKYQWFEEWTAQGDQLPIAVRFDFGLESAAGRQRYSRVYPIPAGGSL